MRKPKTELFQNFRKFHLDNPKVYELFKKFAFEVIRKGHKNFSADAIMHRVRWETNIETTDQEFKICNDHIAYYSRLFMAEYPQCDGFFRTKDIHPNIKAWLEDIIIKITPKDYKFNQTLLLWKHYQ